MGRGARSQEYYWLCDDAVRLCFLQLVKMNIPGFVKITIPTMLTGEYRHFNCQKVGRHDAAARWELHRQAEQEDRTAAPARR